MNPANRRPRTIAEVARRAAAGEQKFDPALLEFLDTFYTNPDERSAAIAEPRALLGGFYDPYLAAVAEHVERRW